jgi:uncharacterized membrane protein
MRRRAIAYAATLAVFLALDGVWLSLTTSRLYRPLLGALLAPAPALWAAAVFYLVYVAGLTGFVVLPGGARTDSLGDLLRGAGFGFVAYATYDLTNQATLQSWPVAVTAADLAWGAVVSALAAAAGSRVVRAMSPARA